MSAFDADYQPLYEMYDDEYFPDFLVDKIKAELDKIEAVLAGGEKNTALLLTLKKPCASASGKHAKNPALLRNFLCTHRNEC